MNDKDLNWEDAQTFLAVAESGSFSRAARLLNLGQPSISRRIKNLEQKVAQQLFTRGKYGAKPTLAADRLMPAAIQMAKWASEFDRAAKDVEQSATGLIKIACPPGIAVEQLAPFSAWLAIEEPGIRLEVLSAIDHVDLTRGTADIAIRTQYPNEPELTVLHEFVSQPGIYGSPEYVSQLHQPTTWQKLDWVTWSGRYQHVEPRPLLEKLIPDFSPVLSSDDYLVQKSAVKAGIGVMICNAPIDSETTELIPIDIGVTLPESPFYIVCVRSVQHVALVQKVVGLMVENFTRTGHTQTKNSDP